jgi:hypothetical protein
MRERFLGVRVDPQELEAITCAATSEHLRAATWARARLLELARETTDLAPFLPAGPAEGAA